MSLEKSEKTPEEIKKQEAIRSIEAINTGSEQKAQLILVLLDLKLAAVLSLYPWNSSPEETEYLLEKTSMKYLKKKVDPKDKAIAEYVVSKDEKKAIRLLSPISDTEYGTLMGYPETAIEAFEKKDTYEGPMPEDIEHSLFQLKFSKANFEEEFEIVRSWNKVLQEYAPDLAKG